MEIFRADLAVASLALADRAERVYHSEYRSRSRFYASRPDHHLERENPCFSH